MGDIQDNATETNVSYTQSNNCTWTSKIIMTQDIQKPNHIHLVRLAIQVGGQRDENQKKKPWRQAPVNHKIVIPKKRLPPPSP